MAAPDPSLIVTNPPPLNPNGNTFPFAVLPFPAVDLRDTVGLFAAVSYTGPDPVRPANDHRYE